MVDNALNKISSVKLVINQEVYQFNDILDKELVYR